MKEKAQMQDLRDEIRKNRISKGVLRFLCIILYVLIQCTWGLLQTLAGFVVFLINIRQPHEFYRGCISTVWNKEHLGVSLGLFIFVEPGSKTLLVRTHEYGHTFQSLVLGPFYFPVVGLISVVWANLPYFRRKRKEKKIKYTACFIESSASRIGERVTGEKATWT